MAHVVMLLKLKGAKSRLSPFFSPRDRLRLAGLFAAHVLQCAQHYPIVVLSPDSVGYACPEDDNINCGITLLRKKIDDGVAVVTSDLPLLGPENIDALVGDEKTLTIARSHNGGTSGLFIPKGLQFTPMFGKNSAGAHVLQAEQYGIPYKEIIDESFHDVDTNDDIAWVMEKCAGTRLFSHARRIISGV